MLIPIQLWAFNFDNGHQGEVLGVFGFRKKERRLASGDFAFRFASFALVMKNMSAAMSRPVIQEERCYKADAGSR